MSNFMITKVTAFVAIDPVDGDEGVMAFKTPGGWMPLVCADEPRIQQMLAIAAEISEATGVPYRIVQFSTREDVTDQVKKEMAHPQPGRTTM